MDQRYDEGSKADRSKIRNHILGEGSERFFEGTLKVENGMISNDLTIISANSFAEDVKVYRGESLYTGDLTITGGQISTDDELIRISGKSLLHSAPLTTVAFSEGFFGDYGKYIVSIGLLLFAFSTTISWSYYGGRATTFLFGTKYEIYYKFIYVVGFFLASFADTTIIWTLANITIALMAIPNLIGILLLHREMKDTVKQYWSDFKLEWPDEKMP